MKKGRIGAGPGITKNQNNHIFLDNNVIIYFRYSYKYPLLYPLYVSNFALGYVYSFPKKFQNRSFCNIYFIAIRVYFTITLLNHIWLFLQCKKILPFYRVMKFPFYNLWQYQVFLGWMKNNVIRNYVNLQIFLNDWHCQC